MIPNRSTIDYLRQNFEDMKSTLFTCTFLICSFFALSQPTWEMGSTTVTEFDLVTDVNLPWEIAWGPDDHIWATLRSGQVIRINPETGNYTEVLDLDVTSGGSSEPGLLGMTFHPDWDNTPIVYVVYNYGSVWAGGERLSSFEWDGNNLLNEIYILDEIPSGGIHNGSRLIITPDNKILMSTGDTGESNDAQNTFLLNGKMLRINLDGSVPDDNPIDGSYVYSFGHRNSQGLCLGPTGIIYSSEHGQSNSDEFNIIEPNRNYGWPNVEGACNTASELTFCDNNNVKEPLAEWSPCIAVNGIEYYNHPAIPDLENTILMSVLGGLGGQYERLSVLHLSADGLEVTGEDQYFSSFNQRIRDICVNPYTGAIYVAFNGPQYPGSGPNIIKEFRNMDFGISIPEIEETQTIHIFPNPVRDSATIAFSDEFLGTTYYIYDISGKLIKRDVLGSSKIIINSDDYKPGKYFVKSTTHLGTVSKTFVIE